jgi:hypothetical protein
MRFKSAGLLGRGGAGRDTLRVGVERGVLACSLEGLEGDAPAEFCNSDHWRVIFLDEFPET